MEGRVVQYQRRRHNKMEWKLGPLLLSLPIGDKLPTTHRVIEVFTSPLHSHLIATASYDHHNTID